ncbi:MAG: sigma-54-dependent Fis family transcriptional regulator, partial [Bacillus sp. (in: Bacteria)]|nr:sigma-54-dependent Fis family transcriptional regulator [Bacillus sp. (in: firmicutes)]
YVLSLSGNEKTLKDARSINLIEGVRWTEEEVGTNAIGTSLKTGEALIINGAEHYSVASHQWSCSATPIFDDNKNVLGVIDISCPIDQTHPLMIGLVTSISYAVEREISRLKLRQGIALSQHAIELSEIHRNCPFIICDLAQTIIFASKSVREKFSHSIGMNLYEFLRNGYQINTENTIYSKEDNTIIGRYIFLMEIVVYKQKILFSASLPAHSFLFKGEKGTSEIFQNTLKNVELVSPTNATVFITGETGTGKELIARAIHDNSSRKSGPYISINCGAIPKDLIESELFGYVAGAFTGANRQGYKGKFEQAHQGTLFLDEIGEIPETMQVALLRVLQERKVVRIGGQKEIPVNIRIITATHCNMFELINNGSFRQDLYYRLNVYPIDVPSLRNRKEDIPHLIRYLCEISNWNIPLTDDFLTRLSDYQWPGNIRELLNVLERLSILSSNGLNEQETNNIMESLKVNCQLLTPSIEDERLGGTKKKLKTREKIQRDLILDALQKTKGNVSAAAKLIEIPRSTFYKRLQKFGI